MAGHSLLSPSSAARWLRCPASVALGQFKPDSSSAFAEEGTCAHALAETVLQARREQFRHALPQVANLDTHFYVGYSLNNLEGNFPPKEPVEGVAIAVDNSHVVDYDMAENIGDYVERIQVDFERPGVVEFHLEYRVDFSRVIGVADSGGTVDVLMIVQKDNDRYRLKIDDLKYGRGVRVEAEENPQLMFYALGALDEWGLVYDIEDVEMTIHQVRLRSETSMVMTVEDLEEFAGYAKTIAQDVNALAATAREQHENGEQVLLPADKFLPSEKGCQFCKVSPCAAQASYVAHIVSEEFDTLDALNADTMPLVGEATQETLSGWLNSVDLVEQFCKDVRQKALAGLLKGQHLPGYKLIRGRPGNRAWESKEEAENVMKSMRVKRDDMYEIKVISPTAAEKLLKKSHPQKWEKLEPMITRAEGKLNIAPENDKAPAVTIDPASDFTELEN